jgi:hypothetical protein
MSIRTDEFARGSFAFIPNTNIIVFGCNKELKVYSLDSKLTKTITKFNYKIDNISVSSAKRVIHVCLKDDDRECLNFLILTLNESLDLVDQSTKLIAANRTDFSPDGKHYVTEVQLKNKSKITLWNSDDEKIAETYINLTGGFKDDAINIMKFSANNRQILIKLYYGSVILLNLNLWHCDVCELDDILSCSVSIGRNIAIVNEKNHLEIYKDCCISKTYELVALTKKAEYYYPAEKKTLEEVVPDLPECIAFDEDRETVFLGYENGIYAYNIKNKKTTKLADAYGGKRTLPCSIIYNNNYVVVNYYDGHIKIIKRS